MALKKKFLNLHDLEIEPALQPREISDKFCVFK